MGLHRKMWIKKNNRYYHNVHYLWLPLINLSLFYTTDRFLIKLMFLNIFDPDNLYRTYLFNNINY